MKKVRIHYNKIHWDQIEASFDEKVAMLYPARREKVLRLKNRRAAIASVATGLYLQEIVKQELGIEPENLVIETNEHGKPMVAGHPDFFFNISHSGDRVLIGFGNSPVGVDVELVKEKEMDKKIAQRCFTEWEQEFIKAVEENSFDDIHKLEEWKFFIIWTMKEAYLKYIGTGISVPLDSFEVKPIEHKVLVNSVEQGVKNIFGKDHQDGEDAYIYSVCVDEDCQINIDMFESDNDTWSKNMTGIKF